MSESNAASKGSPPTPAQLKEFFSQIESGNITKERLESFLAPQTIETLPQSALIPNVPKVDSQKTGCERLKTKPGDWVCVEGVLFQVVSPPVFRNAITSKRFMVVYTCSTPPEKVYVDVASGQAAF
jgi:hypothetical protein